MLDLATRLKALDRPALLVRAARHGLVHADQAALVRRLFPMGGAPAAPAKLVAVLLDMEAEAEHARIRRDPAYTHARHIEVLVGLMGAARLLSAIRGERPSKRQPTPDQTKASGSSALRAAT